MGKRSAIEAIAKKLLVLGDERNIVEDREIDKLIFEVTQKIDRNTKYEFRSYLHTFELISHYANPAIKSNNAFIIEKKKIEEFLKDAKKR